MSNIWSLPSGSAFRLVRAGLAAMVHGAVPALHETTASSEVLAMAETIRARRARMAGNVAPDFQINDQSGARGDVASAQ